MKKVLKTSLLVVVMFSTIISYSNEFSTTTNDKKENITNLTFKNVKQGSVVQIKDQNGLLLYKELIEKSGNYSKGFDLTKLPNGDYYFELDKELEIRVIPFQVKFNIVTFAKNEEQVINKPFVRINGNNVFVTKLTLEQKPLKIKIYNQDSNLVFEETLDESQVLKRKYDFSIAERGAYRMVLLTDGRKYSKGFDIK